MNWKLKEFKGTIVAEKAKSDMIEVVAIKPGNQTSEHAMAKAAGWRAWVGIAIGAIIAVGPMLLPALQDNALAASIIGGLIMVASKLSAIFPESHYIKGRGDLKAKAVDK